MEIKENTLINDKIRYIICNGNAYKLIWFKYDSKYKRKEGSNYDRKNKR